MSLGSLFLLGLILILPLSGQAGQTACGPDASPTFQSVDDYQGIGSWLVQDDHTLALLLEPATRSEEKLLVRIALYPQFSAGLEEGDFATRAQGSMTVSDRKSTFYREIEVLLEGDQESAFTFFLEQRDCQLASGELQRYLASNVHPVIAISTRTLPTSTDLYSEDVRAILDSPLLVSDPDAPMSRIESGEESPLSAVPSRCQSGGPGALSCSITRGGFGPRRLGSCDITCAQRSYACCGPSLDRAQCACLGGQTGSGGEWLPAWLKVEAF
ncbi:MAG: hypothetical protein ACXIUB_12000 [Wenzhouxiangella sp.]